MPRPHALPAEALLAKYTRGGAYTDCYATEVPGAVSHARFVEAFYTTPAFKLERLLLAWFASKPSSDAQARQLAEGSRDSFAAWDVEARGADQLLLRDMGGRTRSWLMVAPVAGGAAATRLYFGSAVVPVISARSGRAEMGFAFRALLGFHKIYSKVLLRSARARLALERPL